MASEKQVQIKRQNEAGPRGFKSIFPAFAIFSRRLSIFFSTRLSTTLLVRRACLKWMTKHMSPMACLCQRPQCANRRNITASGRALLSCRLIRGKNPARAWMFDLYKEHFLLWSTLLGAVQLRLPCEGFAVVSLHRVPQVSLYILRMTTITALMSTLRSK